VGGVRGGESSSFPHNNGRFEMDERGLDVGYKMMLELGLRA